MHYEFSPQKASILVNFFGERIVPVGNSTIRLDQESFDEEIFSIIDLFFYFKVHSNHMKKILQKTLDFTVYKCTSRRKRTAIRRIIGKGGNILMKLMRRTASKIYVRGYSVLVVGGDIEKAYDFLSKVDQGRSYATAEKRL